MLIRNVSLSELRDDTQETVQRVRSYNYPSYKSDDLKRRFRLLSKAGDAVLPEAKYRELIAAVSAMESNYAKVRVCDYRNADKCDLQLEPEITDVLEHSRDPEELKYYWQQWYDKAGKPTRSDFDTYVRLLNEAAVLNSKNGGKICIVCMCTLLTKVCVDFTSNAEAWLDVYEDATFEQQLVGIFDQVRPLYEQLHGYVRARLLQQYGPEVVCRDGPIPMHLLRNMWGQSWENVSIEIDDMKITELPEIATRCVNTLFIFLYRLSSTQRPIQKNPS